MKRLGEFSWRTGDAYWLLVDIDGTGERWHLAVVEINRHDRLGLLFPVSDFDDFIEHYEAIPAVQILEPTEATC